MATNLSFKKQYLAYSWQFKDKLGFFNSNNHLLQLNYQGVAATEKSEKKL